MTTSQIAVTTPTLPSGAQLRISHGDQAATVTEVGAAVREFRVGLRDTTRARR